MKNNSILMVDDEILILKGICSIFDRKEYQITTTDSGRRAVELLKKQSFDLVITDLVMGQIDGIQVLKKAKELNPEIMVIILTGYGNTKSVIEALRLGADDYLMKPCEPEEIIFRVEHCLEKSENKKKLKQAEEALRASQGKLSAMIASMSDRISVVDKDLNIIWANETAKGLFGEDLIGKKCYQAYYGRETPCKPYPCFMLKAFEDERSHTKEIQVIGKDRLKRYFFSTANVALRDKNGKPAAVMEISRDITASKQAEEKLDRAKTFLENVIKAMPNPVFVKNERHQWTFFNDALCNLIGRSRVELLGKSDYDFFLKQEAGMSGEKDRPFLNIGETHEKEEYLTDSEGMVHTILIRETALTDETGKKILIGVITDVTELKKARKVAEAADHAKSEFITNMSHEIRTPMNTIMGFTELLKEKIRDEELKQYLAEIFSAGKLLTVLIDNILELSKIEAGEMKIKYKAASPVLLLNEIEDVFSHKIQKKSLNFYVETDLNVQDYLLFDEVRLKQVLLNLVGNAVKYTESGFIRITVQTLASEKSPDMVDFIFAVEDTGIGVPEEQQKTIFDAFERPNEKDYAICGGTGLGLAITRRLVEMMGGAISVTGKKGKGSTFTVKLHNIRKVKEPYAAEKKNGRLGDSIIIFVKATIMIVDNIESNRRILLRYLKDYGFDLLEAEDGRQAHDLARVHHPDLILMDMKMPVMDGREATRLIKACEETKDIPIVAVTASVKDAEKECRILCDGCLRKPFRRDELIAELTRFLKHSVKKPVSMNLGSSQPEENSEPDAKAIKGISELIQMLELEFTLRWEEINDMLIVDDANKFAVDMTHAGREYGFPLLTEYGEHLGDFVRTYDTVALKKKVAEFPKIVERIKKYDRSI